VRRHAHNTELLREFAARMEKVREGGGGKYVELHRSRGKFMPRERIAMICDAGTRFLELSPLAAWDLYGGKIHSASMICGIGVVHGRECMFLANDSTIKVLKRLCVRACVCACVPVSVRLVVCVCVRARRSRCVWFRAAASSL
jgi:acetyl-CoA carboxylase carboxyltransferase component